MVDHTYRDFSGVPPTEEDRERYNNKKKEYARRIKNCYTTNEMDDCDGSEAMKKKRGRGNRETRSGSNKFIGFMGTNFPARLHDLLSHDEDISNIITWLPHGRSWIVLDKKEFLRKVAPSHFQISKFESFTRQVNGWGFKRITQGPDINSYYHELFLRGMPHLIQWMKRSTSSGSGRRKVRSDPREEPDFHAISQIHPIPDYYGESNALPSKGQRHGGSPATLEEASLSQPPQLNSSDCREVLDILNEPSPSPPKRKRYTKMKSSKLVSGVDPVMYCSKPTLPSPIQPKAKRTKRSNANAENTTIRKNSKSPNSSNKVVAKVPHRMENEIPLSSKEIVDVKTFWSDNPTIDTADAFYRESPTSRCSPYRSPYPNPCFSDLKQPRYNHPQYSYNDFHAEGVIGEPENFRWDDTEYGRGENILRNNEHIRYHSDYRQHPVNNNDSTEVSTWTRI